MAKVHEVTVSDEPRQAPANYRELDAKVVTSDGEGLWKTWHGAGVATDKACADCGNSAGNLQIYANWGHSYPNGNSWSDYEIVCGSCGRYTLVNDFTEG